MSKEITLTDKQAEEWAVLIKSQLMQPDLDIVWAARLQQLLHQLTGQPDPYFIVNYGRQIQNVAFDGNLPLCNVCAIIDPEVQLTPAGYRCPLHMPVDVRTEEERLIKDLYDIGELAGYYLPGELAEFPGRVMGVLARAKTYLVGKGIIEDEPRHEKEPV